MYKKALSKKKEFYYVLHTPSLLKALPLTLIAASLILLGGCSDSKSKKTADTQIDTKVAVTGTTIKGVLSGALVEACLEADCSGSTDPLASATTDDKGLYSLSVTADQPMTIVLRLRYQEGAQMTCDVPTGCENNTAFGAKLPMPTGLILRSMATIEKSATTVSAHISPVTELATAAALHSGNGILTSDAIIKGSDAVRVLLGLNKGGLLTQIKPVDVTAADANSASGEDLQVSLLAAAFASSDSANTIARINEMAGAVSGTPASTATLVSLTTNALAVLNENEALQGQAAAINALLEKSQAAAAAAAGCDNATCSVTPGESGPTAAELLNLSTNVAAVESLVEDIRTLGWELVPQIERTLDRSLNHNDYDADNLFVQIEEAQTLFDQGDGVTAASDGGVAIEALTAVAGRLVEGYIDCKAESVCATKLADIDTVLDTDEGITWSNDTLTKTGDTWSVTGATYSITGQTSASVNMSITFPVITDLGEDSLGDLTGTLNKNASLKISVSSQSGDASIELTEGSLIAVLSNDLDVAAKDAEVTINSLTFKATNAIVSNNIVTFTGNLTLEAGTSAKQEAINPNSADAILPKSISLKGAFTGTGTKALEAELNFNFDSFDNFSYYVDGQSVDGLLNFTESNAGKTLVTTFGEGDNLVTYTIQYQQGNLHPELVFSCTSTGDSRCPWRAHDNQPEVLYDHEAQQSYSGLETVIDALEFLLYSNPWARLSWYFEMEARHPLYGGLRIPNDLTIDQITGNTAKAITEGDPVESDTNLMLFTSSAKVKGKLSDNLPDMEISLEAKRSARFAANAKLTLDWDTGANSKQLVLSASSSGSSEQSMKDNLAVQIKDKVGTVIDLKLIKRKDRTDNVAGTISKDGTKYATITEEGSNLFFVTYHYNEDGHRADIKSQKFESLF